MIAFIAPKALHSAVTPLKLACIFSCLSAFPDVWCAQSSVLCHWVQVFKPVAHSFAGLSTTRLGCSSSFMFHFCFGLCFVFEFSSELREKGKQQTFSFAPFCNA
uniref:Putative secreted protein n=1 Tax=Amblyomma cajennense TaxID=34607 RepID=A0A023FDQ7_AMBCJ